MRKLPNRFPRSVGEIGEDTVTELARTLGLPALDSVASLLPKTSDRPLERQRAEIRALLAFREAGLTGAELSFRRDPDVVFQFQLSPSMTSLPYSRDYMLTQSSRPDRREGFISFETIREGPNGLQTVSPRHR